MGQGEVTPGEFLISRFGVADRETPCVSDNSRGHLTLRRTPIATSLSPEMSS